MVSSKAKPPTVNKKTSNIITGYNRRYLGDDVNTKSVKTKEQPIQHNRKKPLTGNRIYLDLGTYKEDSLLIRDLKHLGASVEEFFSREVTAVISCRPEAVVVSADQRRKASSIGTSTSRRSLSRTSSGNTHVPSSSSACSPVPVGLPSGGGTPGSGLLAKSGCSSSSLRKYPDQRLLLKPIQEPNAAGRTLGGRASRMLAKVFSSQESTSRSATASKKDPAKGCSPTVDEGGKLPQDFLQVAASLGQKIWPLNRFLRYLEDLRSAKALPVHSKPQPKPQFPTRKLRSPFVKLDTVGSRPVFQELDAWPSLTGAPCSGPSAFVDPRRKTPPAPIQAPTKAKGKLGPSKAPINLSTRAKASPKAAKNLRSTKKPSSAPGRNLKKLPPATLKKVPSLELAKRAVTWGYCEICSTDYKDLSVHVETEIHQNFVTNSKNYQELDELIAEDRGLSSVLEASITEKKSAGANVMVTSTRLSEARVESSANEIRDGSSHPPVANLRAGSRAKTHLPSPRSLPPSTRRNNLKFNMGGSSPVSPWRAGKPGYRRCLPHSSPEKHNFKATGGAAAGSRCPSNLCTGVASSDGRPYRSSAKKGLLIPVTGIVGAFNSTPATSRSLTRMTSSTISSSSLSPSGTSSTHFTRSRRLTSTSDKESYSKQRVRRATSSSDSLPPVVKVNGLTNGSVHSDEEISDVVGSHDGKHPKRKSQLATFLEDNANYYQLPMLESKLRSHDVSPGGNAVAPAASRNGTTTLPLCIKQELIDDLIESEGPLPSPVSTLVTKSNTVNGVTVKNEELEVSPSAESNRSGADSPCSSRSGRRSRLSEVDKLWECSRDFFRGTPFLAESRLRTAHAIKNGYVPDHSAPLHVETSSSPSQPTPPSDPPSYPSLRSRRGSLAGPSTFPSCPQPGHKTCVSACSDVGPARTALEEREEESGPNEEDGPDLIVPDEAPLDPLEGPPASEVIDINQFNFSFERGIVIHSDPFPEFPDPCDFLRAALHNEPCYKSYPETDQPFYLPYEMTLDEILNVATGGRRQLASSSQNSSREPSCSATSSSSSAGSSRRPSLTHAPDTEEQSGTSILMKRKKKKLGPISRKSPRCHASTRAMLHEMSPNSKRNAERVIQSNEEMAANEAALKLIEAEMRLDEEDVEEVLGSQASPSMLSVAHALLKKKRKRGRPRRHSISTDVPPLPPALPRSPVGGSVANTPPHRVFSDSEDEANPVSVKQMVTSYFSEEPDYISALAPQELSPPAVIPSNPLLSLGRDVGIATDDDNGGVSSSQFSAPSSTTLKKKRTVNRTGWPTRKKNSKPAANGGEGTPKRELSPQPGCSTSSESSDQGSTEMAVVSRPLRQTPLKMKIGLVRKSKRKAGKTPPCAGPPCAKRRKGTGDPEEGE